MKFLNFLHQHSLERINIEINVSKYFKKIKKFNISLNNALKNSKILRSILSLINNLIINFHKIIRVVHKIVLI